MEPLKISLAGIIYQVEAKNYPAQKRWELLLH